MAEFILQENEINLKTLEQEIFRMVCEEGRRIMAEVLETLDKGLAKTRDRKKYRHKGSRKTTLKSLMGEVSFARAVYNVVDGSSEKKFVYLLDEQLGFENIGLISSNLAEKMAELVCETSYAEAAKTVSMLTGQTISHGGIWNLTQKLGERIEAVEDRDIELYRQHKSIGRCERKVLFEEADGVMLSMQGKDRRQGKKQEMKIAIFHEGWKKEGKNRYKLHNKQVVNGFEKASRFAERTEAKIASVYDIDEITHRIFNSDGAGWLKRMVDDDAVRQLDPFHAKQSIQKATLHEDIKTKLSRLYERGETEKLLMYVDAYANSMENEEEEKLRKLYSYLEENKEALLPYQLRNIDLPPAPEGLEYRGMGACEHNVFLAVAKRMKHRGASWSRTGANYLGKILALKASDKLRITLEDITRVTLPEESRKEIIEIMSSKKAPKADGKGYAGRVVRRPFADCARTPGRKAIDALLDMSNRMFGL